LSTIKRQLVGRSRKRRRHDRRKLFRGVGVGSPDQRGARRQRSLLLGGRRARSNEQGGERSGEHEAPPAG
jgi:hypothetical protein